jgi:hypothetical protein
LIAVTVISEVMSHCPARGQTGGQFEKATSCVK